MGVSQIVFCVSFNKTCIQIVRKLSLNSAPHSNKYREAKFFNKMISSSKSKRKIYFENSPISAASGKLNLSKNTSSGGKENSRRISVLNTIFMKYISDLMVTSSIAEIVSDKGFLISRVSMARDFTHLNVFWATTSTENATALEADLPGLGFTLRHELSQLRVIGNVPRIIFVKDKHYDNGLKIDYLLSIADFGEDHLHAPYGSEFINQPVVEKKITETSEEKTDDSESGETATEARTLLEETMPVMRHDTFNLDHQLIMEKIMKSLRKSKAVHRFQPNLAVECEGTTNNNFSSVTFDTMSKQERKAALSKFILSRKIIQEKRSQNKYNSELNVPHFEGYESDDENEDENFTNEDYIEEEHSEKEKHSN